MQGPLVDLVVSKSLSGRTGLSVHSKKTKIFHWSKFFFDSLEIFGNQQKQRIFTGDGTIVFLKPSSMVIDVHNIRLGGPYLSQGLLGSWPASASFKEDLSVRRLVVGLSQNGSEMTVRIFRCESPDFALKGMMGFSGKRLFKAHLYFSLSRSRAQKLPVKIREGLIRQKNGWMAVRIGLFGSELTLSGCHGPLFQAKWQGQALGFLG